MLKYIAISLLLISGCVTQNKVLKYVEENPKTGFDISREHLLKYRLDAAEICLEVFPQKETIDTIIVIKDSIQVKRTIDTLYKWFNDTHYVDKEKIDKVLKPYISNKYITRTIYDDRYKVLFEGKDKEFFALSKKYETLQSSFYKIRKGLILTWAWIFLIALGIYLYKRR